MSSKKNIFAILGGIFLMVAGTILLINLASNIFPHISAYSSARSLLSVSLNLQVDILLILSGLFLTLRKTKPAAIMLMIAAALYFIVAIMSIVNAVRYAQYYGAGGNIKNILNTMLFLMMLVLGAVGLFLKRTGALVLCLIAAGCRFIQMIVTYAGGIPSTARGLIVLLAALLQIAALVFAGLYLSGKDDSLPVQSYDYGTGF